MHLPSRLRPAMVIAACVALLASALAATPAHAEEVQHIDNGTFDSTTAPWWGSDNAPVSVLDGRLCAQVAGGTANPWDASIGHGGIPLVSGDGYKVRFTASASAPTTVKANVQLNEAPYTAVLSRDIVLTTAPQVFSYDFSGNLDSPNGVLTFQLGGAAAAFTFCLDDVSLTSEADTEPAPEQLTNGDFADGTAGWISYGAPVAVADGRLCADVPGGLANPWDAGVGQNNVRLEQGAQYTLSFTGSATPPTSVNVVVQLGQEPWTSAFTQAVALDTDGASPRLSFTSPIATDNGQVMFQLGGAAAAYRFCLDDVSLRGGTSEPPYTPDTGPRVRVNQVGYLPHGPKHATIVTGATEALPWQLQDTDGDVVARGTTTPRGLDAASGQNVHTADFTSVTRAGTGYTLSADGQTSHPFDLSGTVYDQLRSDALHFFYLQRSGIEIEAELAGEKYARPAGHLGVAPNKGDTDVPCQPEVCDHRLDVRGGWYDAGDHGKYVVNGGIATYQLLSTFERTKTAVTAGHGEALGDGTLRVPERGNKVPDVLDEARWELEFLMRMQVPAGKPLAGMAHHKMHDQNWTGLPMLPHDDPQLRELHPPSTAATLNLAAVAAQCARLFAPYDAAFAARCLTSARTGYLAAKANPKRYADPNDGTGGGAYSDEDVTDEFYWAAAELYLTTGDAAFWRDVTDSPHHTAEVFATGGYYWGSTAALGRLDLATVPSAIGAAERQRVRASVTAAADKYLAVLTAEAYGLPIPGESKNYVWGSTSGVVNNAIVLGTAFDLTTDGKYRDGAVQAMDYILGRNGLNHSYVTGWGEKNSQNQHSRIFAHQLDPDLPNPPAGSLAGGPNVELQDPYAKELLSGCKPMFCYVDHIDSWSTNEVAINWNSALAWMASFLADQGTGQKPAPGRCRVAYTNHGSWGAGNGFTGQVVLTNTGDTPIDGWTLRFAFTGDQKLRETWTARMSQVGAMVTAKNESYNARIHPGGQVTFGFTAKSEGGANPPPGLFTLDGAACT